MNKLFKFIITVFLWSAAPLFLTSNIFAGSEIVEAHGSGAGQDHYVRIRCEDGTEFTSSHYFPSGASSSSTSVTAYAPAPSGTFSIGRFPQIYFGNPDQTSNETVDISSHLIRDNGGLPFRSREQIRQSTIENINKCKKHISDLSKSTGGRKQLDENIRSKITDTIASFDRGRAVKLHNTVSSLSQSLDERTADIFCSIEQVADVITSFNDSTCTDAVNCSYKDIAKESLDISLDDLTQAVDLIKANMNSFEEKLDSHVAAREIARVLLAAAADLGISSIPGVSMARDIYEAVTGRNILTGEELSEVDRIMAAVSAGTLGVGRTPLKVLEKIAKAAHNSGKVAIVEKGLARTFYKSEKTLDSAGKHGIKIVTGSNATKVDKVILETLEGKGNLTSKFKLTADEALQAGEKWVGPSYREIGKPGQGVFRSADGKRQFRMDNGSLTGAHDPNVPHVHFQEVLPDGRQFKTNNHVPFEN